MSRATTPVGFKRRVLHGKRLKPGRYPLVLTAAVAGAVSKPARLGFTILAG